MTSISWAAPYSSETVIADGGDLAGLIEISLYSNEEALSDFLYRQERLPTGTTGKLSGAALTLCEDYTDGYSMKVKTYYAAGLQDPGKNGFCFLNELYGECHLYEDPASGDPFFTTYSLPNGATDLHGSMLQSSTIPTVMDLVFAPDFSEFD